VGPTPAVSILLPARNAAATLPRALASLQQQTLTAWECLLVDDGSNDATPAIAARAAARDPRIRLHRLRPARGLVAALNLAARRARAPIWARQDADDCSAPERLAASLALLRSSRALGAVATQVRITCRTPLPEGWRRYEQWSNACVTPEEIERDLWVESPLVHPAVMLRAAAWRAVGGYRAGPWPEDYDLWLRLAHAGWRFAKVPRILYAWTHHAGRLTATDARYSAAAFLACKLRQLAPRLHRARVIVWGAGRDGRRLARALRARAIEPVAFIDVDPRKIGRRRLGRPVWPPEHLRAGARPSPGRAPLVLVAVGTAGARALIRERLKRLGFREGRDFLCLH